MLKGWFAPLSSLAALMLLLGFNAATTIRYALPRVGRVGLSRAGCTSAV